MLALAALAWSPGRVAPSCNDRTTIEVEACLDAELKTAQADLDRYLTATRTHLANWPGRPTTPTALVDEFDAAQRRRARYREQQCGVVSDQWAGGTIRGAKELTCLIRLTRARTHVVWQTFLTYPDSTPPILPEPPAGG